MLQYSLRYSHFLRMQADSNGPCMTAIRYVYGEFCLISDIYGRQRAAMWWAHQDSNLEPKDYESSALTIEL